MNSPNSVCLHFAAARGIVPPSIGFTAPTRILSADALNEVIPALLAVEEAALAGSWCVGWIAYEAAPAFDAAMPACEHGSTPLLWFGVYDSPEELAEPETGDAGIDLTWAPRISREEYNTSIAAIRQAIERGDVYQANYTFGMEGRLEGDLPALYHRLRSQNQQGYSALITLPQQSILSLSPELFFSIETAADGSRTIVTRPMKGTRARGRTAEEDLHQRNELLHSEKDRAENVMIVDLLRNDLGRIAEIGSVQVVSLFDAERFPTVWQMTSTISATLKPRTTLADMLRALFPCGSITGAPKIAAMHLLQALENEPRGPYCGTIGVVKPGGDAVFNVAIRTVVVDNDTQEAVYRVGGGITYDSAPQAEYEEAMTKARAVSGVQPRYDLIETLGLHNGTCIRQAGHLARMAASADYFGYTFCRAEAERILEQLEESHPAGSWRVRLVLTHRGEISYSVVPLEAPPDCPTFRVAPQALAVDPNGPLLYHKTACREVYDRAYAVRGDCWEVLLTNQRGELTEFTRGSLAIQLEGRCCTPALACGVLPGVYRGELLAADLLQEAVLTPEDLARAERIWFINSLRGWIELKWEGILPV